MTSPLKVVRLAPEAILPTRAHQDDAALDFYACEDCVLAPSHGRPVKTGIAVEIPQGFAGLIAPRSSMGKRGVVIAGGVIDAGYRGEILAMLWNISSEVVEIKKGDRVGQMMILPIALPLVEEVLELGDTARGVNGFGSTGQ